MSQRANVLHEVYQERDRQDFKWGGAEHDDHHDGHEWVGLVRGHAQREPMTPADRRRLLIEVAALAVAAVESLDRQVSNPTRRGR